GGLSDVGAHQLRAHRGAFPPLAPARRQSCGAKNSWARTAEILLGDEVEALTRTAMARALEGDGPALRLCLDRIIAPGASRSPAAAGPADIAAAMAAVTAAVAGGVITPGGRPRWQRWYTPTFGRSRRATLIKLDRRL